MLWGSNSTSSCSWLMVEHPSRFPSDCTRLHVLRRSSLVWNILRRYLIASRYALNVQTSFGVALLARPSSTLEEGCRHPLAWQ